MTRERVEGGRLDGDTARAFLAAHVLDALDRLRYAK
jgi:hypothetical protein